MAQEYTEEEKCAVRRISTPSQKHTSLRRLVSCVGHNVPKEPGEVVNDTSNCDYTNEFTVQLAIKQGKKLARAYYDYTSNMFPDAMSFKKNDLLEVLSTGTMWWEARKISTGETGFVPSNYLVMMRSSSASWYHDEMNQTDCEQLLLKFAPGTFLVRMSETRSEFYLSIANKDSSGVPYVSHNKICYDECNRCFVDPGTEFESLADLIKHYKATDDTTLCCRLTNACLREKPPIAMKPNIHQRAKSVAVESSTSDKSAIESYQRASSVDPQSIQNTQQSHEQLHVYISDYEIQTALAEGRIIGRAYFDYSISREGILDVKRGDIFEITSTDNEHWWYATNLVTQEKGYVPRSYLVLENNFDAYPWYHGEIGLLETEKRLLEFNCLPGSFAVSLSQTMTRKFYYLSLLVGTSTVEQYEIFYDGEGKCSVELSDKKCDSLVELIEFYQNSSNPLLRNLGKPCPRMMPKQPSEDDDDDDFIPKPPEEVVDPNILHPHIYCYACRTNVKGIRYKCQLCHQFDLCSSCKEMGVHSDHNMMVIKKPAEKLSDMLLANWNQADKGNHRFTRQTLDPAAEEYRTVIHNMTSAGGKKWAKRVKQIQRIENRTLFRVYIELKKELEEENGIHFENERILWHGTNKEALTNIYMNGFNRGYCGKNSTAFGDGVYFAKDFMYSARSTYSPPDTNGVKYIFQCRALTGQFTKGSIGLKEPPMRTAELRYDSCVDDVGKPTVFVIFTDMKVYPEYIISLE